MNLSLIPERGRGVGELPVALFTVSPLFIAMSCWVKKLLLKQLLQDWQLNGVLLMTLLKQLPVLRPKDLWKVMKSVSKSIEMEHLSKRSIILAG